MACTTILVGKKASYDGSTLIARNDDSPTGVFTSKKLMVIEKNKQPKIYKSKISKISIPLPDTSYRFTCMPNVIKDEGIWGACGINEKNVAMTATETITSNPRVLGADPLLKNNNHVQGIGEEDLVMLVLPYINSAKEGVIRLGKLLEEYGTYESNGIAFSDQDEIWWLETIGGHHWIARKVDDNEYVVMPNQFGLDKFDFDDAFSNQKENMCSQDLKEFIINNHLNLNLDNEFNPRLAFGSHSDSDHSYNTPRAWFMERYLNPNTFKWDGENANFSPLSNDIPWSLVPERKITIEDIKYLLSSHYQGTEYDPYSRFNSSAKKGAFRPIGISRTSFMAILQIRPYVKKENAAIEWICFGSNVFNTLIPFYTNTNKVPTYLSNTTSTVNTNNFYWASRLIGALTDAHYNTSIIHVERYQDATMAASYNLINEFDKKINENNYADLIIEANNKITKMIENETNKVLDKVLYDASCHMKNGYSRSDN